MTQIITKNFTKLALVLASFGLLALPLAVNAQQEDTTVQVSVNSVITAFTTSGTVTLGALTPTPSGTQSIANDTVSVTTNDVNGYTLTMEDQDANVNLVSGSNNFTASSGTPASPVALTNNTWGWRVDNLSAFGAGPTGVLSNGTPSSLTFAAVPTNGNPVTIKTTSGTGADATEVWYSARADTTQPEGTYTDIVVYTATGNP